MPTLIHIAEVALLLAVAYTLGWALGYAARRLARRRPEQPAAAIPAARLAAATGQPPPEPLVKSPEILPLPVAEPAPPPAPAALPATKPGEAWSGEIRGRPASRFHPETPAAPPTPPDEDAAMRAVEGSWSRTHARALPDAPELTDLGVAVAAAQSAVAEAISRLESDSAADPEK